MHGLAVYVKEGLPFARDLPLENCRFLLILSTGLTSLSVLLLFLLITFFILCTVFDAISSDIDEALSINLPANVFIFGDYKGELHPSSEIFIILLWLIVLFKEENVKKLSVFFVLFFWFFWFFFIESLC